MTTHTFDAETFLPYPREHVFAFFSRAENLGELTPATLQFRILPPTPVTMEEGTEITYRIRLRGWPMKWKSRITGWNPPQEFSDEQLVGPYHRWIHRHTFESADGGTWLRDHVQYVLPFPPFGELLRPFIAAELRSIFAYRKQAMERIFPAPTATASHQPSLDPQPGSS